MKKTFFIPLLALLLSGCFETDFNFKTVLNEDGSVLRETRIDGRGGAYFKTPEGPGWQAKSWETAGGGTLIPSTFYHISATGKFSRGQAIPSDYQFDFAKQAQTWNDQDLKRLEKAGIATPYEEHLYSRNEIRVRREDTWLTRTYHYEEDFHNVGVIPVLLLDLVAEIRKSEEAQGRSISPNELQERARLYLEKEILPQIRFQAAVIAPGRVMASNSKHVSGNRAEWSFTMADFEENNSLYRLRFSTRKFRLKILLAAALAVVVLFIFAFGMWFSALASKTRKAKASEEKPAERKGRRKESR